MTTSQLQKERELIREMLERRYGQTAAWLAQIGRAGDRWIVSVPGQQSFECRVREENAKPKM